MANEIVMDKRSIVFELGKMSQSLHQLSQCLTAAEWDLYRNKSIWPNARRVFHIVTGEQSRSSKVMCDEWSMMLEQIGLCGLTTEESDE